MAYHIEAAKCTACGACAEGCPENAIAFVKATGVYGVNPDACIDCGACESACASGAVRPAG